MTALTVATVAAAAVFTSLLTYMTITVRRWRTQMPPPFGNRPAAGDHPGTPGPVVEGAPAATRRTWGADVRSSHAAHVQQWGDDEVAP